MRAQPLSALADRFAAGFPLAREGRRTVGREAEFPVVHPDGSAADVAALWPHLLATGDWKVKRERDLIVGIDGPRNSYALEVGWGTMESILEPSPDLHAMAASHEAAVEPLLRAAEREGLCVLGYGIQPLTPATPGLMAPKQRYAALLEAIGAPWLWFTLTASDQTHVAISRPEFAALTSLGNGLAPVLVALCANSPVHDGAPSGFLSAREGRMGEIHADDARHGMLPRAVADFEDYVRLLARQPCLVRREGERLIAGSVPFDQLVQDLMVEDQANEGAFQAFLLHEHYIWNSARPRSTHGTLEFRAACQQPMGEHMAAAALALGFVEAAPSLAAFLRDALGDDPWPALRRYHHAVIREGLRAEEPASGFVRGVLDRCAEGLEARGLGEQVYLEPHFRRLDRRQSPGHAALQAFEAGGVPALVAATRGG